MSTLIFLIDYVHMLAVVCTTCMVFVIFNWCKEKNIDMNVIWLKISAPHEENLKMLLITSAIKTLKILRVSYDVSRVKCLTSITYLSNWTPYRLIKGQNIVG